MQKKRFSFVSATGGTPVVPVVAAIAACFSVFAGESISLDGDWELSWRHQEEKGAWRTIPAQVPGDAFVALERAGLLPDLTVGTNVWAAFPWEQCEWRYARTFAAPRPKRTPPS